MILYRYLSPRFLLNHSIKIFIHVHIASTLYFYHYDLAYFCDTHVRVFSEGNIFLYFFPPLIVKICLLTTPYPRAKNIFRKNGVNLGHFLSKIIDKKRQVFFFYQSGFYIPFLAIRRAIEYGQMFQIIRVL